MLRNTALWGHDLTRLPGFAEGVTQYLDQLLEKARRPRWPHSAPKDGCG